MLKPTLSVGNIIKPDQLIANKIPIAPAGETPIKQSHKVKKVASKPSCKTRMEHVVIEKRYRMKLAVSFNMLKDMLNCNSEKKVCLCQRLF